MSSARQMIHPLRKDAILTDENGRKWRIVGDANDALTPDHTDCKKNSSCKHYGEIYF